MAVCVGCGLQVTGDELSVKSADDSITCSEAGLCASALDDAGQDFVPALETTSSISYTNLATPGPTVTITTGTQALVYFMCGAAVTSGGPAFMSIAVSGASAISASDEYAIENPIDFRFWTGYSMLFTGLTAGSNTFQAKYRCASTGIVSFSRRRLIVVP
jgi:hypothetical protein